FRSQEIERFLLENPMLERDEPDGGEYASGPTPAAGSAQDGVNGSEQPSEQDNRDAAHEEQQGIDWSDTGSAPGASSTRDRDNDEEVDFQEFQPAETSLREHLDQQIALSQMCDRDRALARKSTRLNSSHVKISYAVFCL